MEPSRNQLMAMSLYALWVTTEQYRYDPINAEMAWHEVAMKSPVALRRYMEQMAYRYAGEEPYCGDIKLSYIEECLVAEKATMIARAYSESLALDLNEQSDSESVTGYD